MNEHILRNNINVNITKERVWHSTRLHKNKSASNYVVAAKCQCFSLISKGCHAKVSKKLGHCRDSISASAVVPVIE